MSAPARSMQCPSCRGRLRRREQGQVTLRECAAHGFWFAPDAWRLYLERIGIPPPPMPGNADMARADKPLCPECRGPTVTEPHIVTADAMIPTQWHACPEDGVWVQRTEMATLIEHARRRQAPDDDGDPDPRRCPECARHLRRVEQRDVTLSWCRMHGYLFTAEQWQQFIRRLDPGHEPTPDDDPIADRASRDCPDCGAAMDAVGSQDPWRTSAPLAWHRCTAHGVWISIEDTVQLLQRAQAATRRKRRVRDLHEQIRAEGEPNPAAEWVFLNGGNVNSILQLLFQQ